jgi:endonuclease YncB( thermonuclease family)
MRTFTPRYAVPLLALLLVTAIAQAQESFTGKVVSVTDGDTIQVMHNGRAEKIRLWGIDTPEKAQAFGTKAKQFTSEQAFGKVVTVEVKDTDRYGRTVGVVTLPSGKILNRELVSHGLAWWYEQYAPKDRSLQRLHSNAAKGKLGLWRDPNPVAPGLS